MSCHVMTRLPGLRSEKSELGGCPIEVDLVVVDAVVVVDEDDKGDAVVVSPWNFLFQFISFFD